MTGRVKIFLCTFLLQKYGRVTEWRIRRMATFKTKDVQETKDT